jgi:hypothetical protein
MLKPDRQSCYSSIGTWKVSRPPLWHPHLQSPFFHPQAWPLTADRRTPSGLAIWHQVSSPRVIRTSGAAVPDPSVAFPHFVIFHGLSLFLSQTNTI